MKYLKWLNLISNICVFDSGLRSQGVGTALLEKILEVAEQV